ncbi:hypothetical protein [Streptomyces sp. C10-9-1]|uniref:hypothetical protein n=1 Tax=Streptomyces sp. C10-9-1 TaxID=1859285 RepID=UPI003F4A458D
MRHAPAPGRSTALLAAVFAVLASAGCMSVGQDEGAPPAPSTSTSEGPDEVQEAGADRGAPGGQFPAGHGGGRPAVGDGDDPAEDGDGKGGENGADEGEDAAPAEAGAPPGPSGSPTRGASPRPGGGQGKPDTHPSTTPPGPSAEPGTPTPEPPSEPPQEPEPEPSEPAEPTGQPSASSAPEVHGNALRTVADGEPEARFGPEPAASPQAGPV